MWTSAVLVDDAVPVQPLIAIALVTVVLSGMVTSVPLLPVQAGGGVPPPRFRVQLLMNPVSADAASCTRSRHVPFAASLDTLVVNVWSTLSALPPLRFSSV